LAVAQRVHLATLLQALLEGQLCTPRPRAISSESWNGTRYSTTRTEARLAEDGRISGGLILAVLRRT
jgi:hypothetical protein